MGLTDLLKTNMERHPETFGDALQLCQRDVFSATRYGIKIGTFHVQLLCQFRFTDVFFPALLSLNQSLFLFSLYCRGFSATAPWAVGQTSTKLPGPVTTE